MRFLLLSLILFSSCMRSNLISFRVVTEKDVHVKDVSIYYFDDLIFNTGDVSPDASRTIGPFSKLKSPINIRFIKDGQSIERTIDISTEIKKNSKSHQIILTIKKDASVSVSHLFSKPKMLL